MPDPTIIFNVKVLTKLKKAYVTAKYLDQTQFTFEGNEVLTDYAKYLIQYLNIRFGIKE